MDSEYLSGLLKLLEELQAAIKSNDEKSIRNLDQRNGQIEKYIGSMEHLADVLRLCQSKYGCHNEYVHSALDWVSAATPSKGISPYPALWDNLANKKFVDELRRWIKEVSGEGGEIKRTAETERTVAGWRKILGLVKGIIKAAFQIFTRSFWDSLLHGPK